jgi:RNA polymerase sigma factor (sigma-70 family)
VKTLSIDMSGEQDRRIADAVEQHLPRLKEFIRRRAPEPEDVEDILQDVFYELVEAYRLTKPIEKAGAWLFQVARNRIIDAFRKRRPESLQDLAPRTDEDEALSIEDFLPSPEAGPDAAFARSVLIGELEAALAELPDEQCAVFIAHEIEGRSFKEMSEESGVSLNTLLSRKRYAVLHLRSRLQEIHNEFQNER